MDEFAYFHQMDVATLIHVALFMMLWVGGIVAIDCCVLDERTYEKGIKVSDAEMDALDIRGDTFHPEWNYTVHPRPAK